MEGCGEANLKTLPAGNLLLSAAIQYSSSMISRALRILKILKIQCFSRQTYHKHQRNYLITVIFKNVEGIARESG